MPIGGKIALTIKRYYYILPLVLFRKRLRAFFEGDPGDVTKTKNFLSRQVENRLLMKISRAEVEKTALLARLEFNDQELERMRADLDKILEYAEKLQQLDLDNVPETEHVLSLQNVFREDTVRTWLDNEAALRNAPARKNGYFSIPKVIG